MGEFLRQDLADEMTATSLAVSLRWLTDQDPETRVIDRLWTNLPRVIPPIPIEHADERFTQRTVNYTRWLKNHLTWNATEAKSSPVLRKSMPACDSNIGHR